MLIKTVFAGFGGQGVLSMGLNLAQAAMLEGKNVTYLPSYGAEVRGGTANCTVAVSDEEIASPVASSPDFIVAMNQPSLVRFQNQIQSGGVLFINSSLPKSPGAISKLSGCRQTVLLKNWAALNQLIWLCWEHLPRKAIWFPFRA